MKTLAVPDYLQVHHLLGEEFLLQTHYKTFPLASAGSLKRFPWLIWLANWRARLKIGLFWDWQWHCGRSHRGKWGESAVVVRLVVIGRAMQASAVIIGCWGMSCLLVLLIVWTAGDWAVPGPCGSAGDCSSLWWLQSTHRSSRQPVSSFSVVLSAIACCATYAPALSGKSPSQQSSLLFCPPLHWPSIFPFDSIAALSTIRLIWSSKTR